MTTIRAFFPKIRAHFYNFWKRAEEILQGYAPEFSRIMLKIKSSKIFIELLGLSFPCKLVYPTMVAKNFQIDDVQKTGKQIFKLKLDQGTYSILWQFKEGFGWNGRLEHPSNFVLKVVFKKQILISGYSVTWMSLLEVPPTSQQFSYSPHLEKFLQ